MSNLKARLAELERLARLQARSGSIEVWSEDLDNPEYLIGPQGQRLTVAEFEAYAVRAQHKRLIRVVYGDEQDGAA